MKKSLIFCIVLLFSVILAIGVMSVNASAAETFTEDIYTYTVENGNATIVSADDSVLGDLTIPDTLGGYPVTYIGDCAFYKRDDLTGVTLPKYLSTIESNSFAYCHNLKSVTFNNKLLIINPCAFLYCGSLTSIKLPSSLYVIGGQAFGYCDHLESVSMPNNLSYILKSAFFCCINLKKVTIPAGVEVIEEKAFEACWALESVTFKEGKLTTIGKRAFADCRSLLKISIPDTVTDLGTDTFLGCTELRTVTLGKGITTIGSGTFMDCEFLSTVTVPKNVVKIEEQAFSGCSYLHTLYIASPELIKKLTGINDHEGFLANVRELNIEESCLNKLANAILNEFYEDGYREANGYTYVVLRKGVALKQPEDTTSDGESANKDVDTVTPSEVTTAFDGGLPTVEYIDGIGCSSTLNTGATVMLMTVLCTLAVTCRRKKKPNN